LTRRLVLEAWGLQASSFGDLVGSGCYDQLRVQLWALPCSLKNIYVPGVARYPAVIGPPHFCCHAAGFVRVAFAPLARNRTFCRQRQKNTIQKCYFSAASKTSLCCGDRAWYRRPSAAILSFFSVCSSRAPPWHPHGSRKRPCDPPWRPKGGPIACSWHPCVIAIAPQGIPIVPQCGSTAFKGSLIASSQRSSAPAGHAIVPMAPPWHPHDLP